MCELTYETYAELGGTCSEEMFPRLKADAEADLAMLSSCYRVVWHSDETRTLALVSLIDAAQSTLATIQGGGPVTSLKVGSYSETRAASKSAYSTAERTADIVGRYATLYQKGIGRIM